MQPMPPMGYQGHQMPPNVSQIDLFSTFISIKKERSFNENGKNDRKILENIL